MNNDQLFKMAAAILHKPVTEITRVHGGDISAAYKVTSKDAAYFLKLNDNASLPGMFLKEADGLHAISALSSANAPAVIAAGDDGFTQYLLLSWIEEQQPTVNFWEKFGGSLAAMHRCTNASFGWHTSNYIGSLPQQNTFLNTWEEFFITCRIEPMLKRLADEKKFLPADLKQCEAFAQRINHLFPKEPPALLHGDLWAGNFITAANDIPVLIDPAVYFGHREMDIGMSRLFGGFPGKFYDAYHEAYPLEKGWRQRVRLAQLYPLLVHAVLFGGSYVQQARLIIKNI